MKKLVLIPFLLLFTGCGGPLKNTWTNFTAYYNTYYNAKKDFEDGIARVNQQPVEIDPGLPVRPHPAPVAAGIENFEAAIDNGALILRRFSDSKWTDNALLLMGKSYYYLQDFLLARQKFEELISLPSSPLKQEAIIWKARTLLDTGSYEEGIQFLQDQLENLEESWRSDNRAEAEVLLAEYWAMQGEWEKVAELLEQAVPALDDQKLKGRSYFLWGQALEKNGELIRAFQVYNNVKRYFLDYEYIYWAEMKQAHVSRKGGRNELAATIYNNLLRDDKSFDRRNAIYFELAETYEEQGNYHQAEATYQHIIANSNKSNARQIMADTYYQLGELYSNQYSDYNLAAAYFDSSSSLSIQTQQSTDENANMLAEAYSSYIAFQQEIEKSDSLLQLGSLNDEQLQARLNIIRQQRQEIMRESQTAVQQTRNTLANASEPEMVTNADDPNANTSAFGFLNYRSPELLAEGQQEFRATWGQRPLVDDWRRREAIMDKNIEDTSSSTSTNDLQKFDSKASNDEALGINLAEIPRTSEDREALRQDQMRALYRLGSLFFLTLNQPDSAAKYYRKILELSPDREREAQTLYSLHELYQLKQMQDSSEIYRQQILQRYPNSRYADQIRVRSKDEPRQVAKDTTGILREKAEKLITAKGAKKPSADKAEQLRKLAMQDSSGTLASAIYFEAIREQIRYAHHRDSIAVASDSSSTGEEGGIYTGADWDKVREMIAEFIEWYPGAKQIDQVRSWRSMLQNPEDVKPVLTCRELDIEPVMIPDKQEFVESIDLPENVERMNISGSIQYRLTISKKGDVDSLQLLSNPTNLGIEDIYEKAILEDLRFQPVTQQGNAVRFRCDIEFPISN